jgi:hypothetical protein
MRPHLVNAILAEADEPYHAQARVLFADARQRKDFAHMSDADLFSWLLEHVRADWVPPTERAPELRLVEPEEPSANEVVPVTFGERRVVNGDTPLDDPTALCMFGDRWPEWREELRKHHESVACKVTSIDSAAGAFTVRDAKDPA